MKNKMRVLLLAALGLLTVVAALYHAATREDVPLGILRVEVLGDTFDVPLDGLKISDVSGSIVNGKGESRSVEATGILLLDILREVGISSFGQVVVCADDEYSAVVFSDEVYADAAVYLLIDGDERPQLVVFGDPDSKRNVTDVIRLVVS